MGRERFAKNTADFVLKGVCLANGGLLLCHIYFLIMFKIIGADIMHYVNYASVLTYIILFFFVRNKKDGENPIRYGYVIAVYVEMYVHMVIATICLGFEYGFLLYCFSNVSSIICASYLLGGRAKITRFANIFVVLNVITFVALRIWTYMVEPIYEVNEEFAKSCFMGNSLLVLGFAFYFAKFFAQVTFKQEDTLKNVADYDILTGLKNRRAIVRIFEECSVRYLQEDKLMSVAILDADFFKKINDTYGHDAGDIVLKSLADLLKEKESFTKDFYCGRWGGEEFLIIQLVEKGQKNKVIERLEDIRKAVEQQVIAYQDTEIKYTVTIGATFCDSSSSDGYVITEADQMLYEGKQKSRNCVMHK